MTLSARITRVHGYRDGIRHGKASWSDGYASGFHYDRLNGSARIIAFATNGAEDVTAERARYVPSLLAALAEHPLAGPPIGGCAA